MKQRKVIQGHSKKIQLLKKFLDKKCGSLEKLPENLENFVRSQVRVTL